MKNLILASLFGSVIFAAVARPVISPENERRWQTVFRPDDPLEWRWEDGAATATVTETNLITGVVSTLNPVIRTAAARYGSLALPMPEGADNGEALVDIVLEQRDEDSAVLATFCARLAFLPGTGGNAVDLDLRDRPRGSGVRAVAYDCCWTNDQPAASAEASFTAGASAPEIQSLDWGSGYFPLRVRDGLLTVTFPNQANALSGSVWKNSGLNLMFK